MAMDTEITIRRAETTADYRALQAAQRSAWGIVEEGYVVPIATMVGAQLHGGLVLGAFLPDGEAVGVSFAFLGRAEGRLCLYSQLTGVVPGYQGRNIGYLLKAAQREAARAERVPCLCWAFDPLQAGNARFNLDKLGATCGRYIENMYGFRSDVLNRDATTDRLIAVWETRPSRTPDRPAAVGRDLPRLIDVTTPGNVPAPTSETRLLKEEPALLLEIPAEISRLRADDPELAGRWSSVVRRAFLDAFAAGYRAVGFLRDDAPEGRRHFYILAKGDSGQGAR
jgi:predicted GNAT superfamily acetyltransferase